MFFFPLLAPITVLLALDFALSLVYDHTTLEPLSSTKSMSIKDGWFSEEEVMWPGQKFSLEVRALHLTAVNRRGEVIFSVLLDYKA